MVKRPKHLRITYEICLFILVLIAVTFAFLDLIGKISIISSPGLLLIENCILVIFSIDYFVRLYLSGNKKIYIRQHIFDLIAIIPFNSLFRAFRFVSIIKFFIMTEVFQMVKLIRLIAFVGKLKNKMNAFLMTSGFIYIILATMVTILMGAAGIFYAESGHSIQNFEEALWWSIVTVTTVGYGDIVPVTLLGRTVASLLMATGTTFFGIYIGIITTYFLKKKRKSQKDISKEKIDVSHLDKEEIAEVMRFINFIIHKRKQ